MPQPACHHTVTVNDERQTIILGKRLGQLLDAGDVVSLDGPLGVGKTRFAAGIAAAFGVDRDDVTSPTFTLIHEYHTDPPVAHLDAYRLADSDEFLNLGVSELWDEGIVIVEWGSKVVDALPDDALFITGEIAESGSRVWRLSAGKAWESRWLEVVEL